MTLASASAWAANFALASASNLIAFALISLSSLTLAAARTLSASILLAVTRLAFASCSSRAFSIFAAFALASASSFAAFIFSASRAAALRRAFSACLTFNFSAALGSIFILTPGILLSIVFNNVRPVATLAIPTAILPKGPASTLASILIKPLPSFLSNDGEPFLPKRAPPFLSLRSSKARLASLISLSSRRSSNSNSFVSISSNSCRTGLVTDILSPLMTPDIGLLPSSVAVGEPSPPASILALFGVPF